MNMNFVEIIGLFVCFCGISSAFDLGKEYAKAKMLKATVKQLENTTFGSVFRMILNYKLKKDHLTPDPVPTKVYDTEGAGENV